jgi:hypothetical protein
MTKGIGAIVRPWSFIIRLSDVPVHVASGYFGVGVSSLLTSMRA